MSQRIRVRLKVNQVIDGGVYFADDICYVTEANAATLVAADQAERLDAGQDEIESDDTDQ